MLDSCRSCHSKLVPGEVQARSAQTARFLITAEAIPVRRCVRDCPGLYWSHPDLGVDAFDLLLLSLPHFAEVKGFLFWARQACRGCGGKLHPSERLDFRFGPDASSRSPLMTITVNAATLTCRACKKRFLPEKLYKGDPVHTELGDAISAAMSQDLIWQ